MRTYSMYLFQVHVVSDKVPLFCSFLNNYRTQLCLKYSFVQKCKANFSTTFFTSYSSHVTCKQFRSVSKTMEKNNAKLITDCENLNQTKFKNIISVGNIYL